MKIRRFYSHNVRSALKQVTETFGEEAAILSNKKVSGGVEIIAALDYDESLMPSSGEIEVNQASSTDSSANQAQQDKMGNLPINDSSRQEVPTNINPKLDSRGFLNTQFNNKKQLSGLLAGESELSEQISLTNPAETKLSKKSNMEWSLDPSLQAMKEELELMRSMMTEQLKGIAWNRFTEKDPLKAMIMRRLSELGLNNESLSQLLPHVDDSQDAECCWQHILAVLASSLPLATDEMLVSGGIYAFVGPTGVGKTTTIAKLAARYVIKHGCNSIALISTDNQRITAQEQLATFGRILKIPSANVTEKNSLESLLSKFADKKLVLIDTAGISSNDDKLLSQLVQVKQNRRPIKKLLLMAATSQIAVLQQSIKMFDSISPTALVITKIDEATSLGEILSIMLRSAYPVIYLTDGQKIPEDIRVAKSQFLVSKAVALSNKYAASSEEWRLAQSLGQAKSA